MSGIQTAAHCILLELQFHSNHSGGIRVNRNLGEDRCKSTGPCTFKVFIFERKQY